MDITNMSVVELESLAYKTIQNLERERMNLQALQAEIAKKEKVEPKKD